LGRSPGEKAVQSPRDALLAAPFFAPLPPLKRGTVLGRFHAKTVRAGASVIRQGDSNGALVIVARGRLEVRVERPNGARVLLESIGAGDYIGEGALLTRTPAAAHVVAATDCELMLLLPHDFYEIAGTYPALWSQLKDVAERRARDLQTKLAPLRF
jgi:CRP-like cAMP-binding protein